MQTKNDLSHMKSILLIGGEKGQAVWKKMQNKLIVKTQKLLINIWLSAKS